MKQILAINGSPRAHGNTAALLERAALPLREAGYTVEIVQLSKMDLRPCRGCAACVEKGFRCKTQDEIEILLDQMRAADGILLASPIYMWQVSTLLKQVFDRLVSYFHRPDPQLVGKPVFVLSTSAGPFVYRKGIAYMEEIAHHLGMRPAGHLSQLGASPKPVNGKVFGRFLKLVEGSRTDHRPSLKELFNFMLQQGSAMAFLPEDRKYFIEHGWDKGLYYYPCKINFLKRGIMRFVGWAAGKFAGKIVDESAA
ncbi:MAG: flavodoxin family protein [Anaerolineae bacterium]|nr:flavodoxin family protein [Anaerolineae bacterium]